ncbi:reverse transcriptase domain-containing protein, partial [Prevotella sp. CAG:255]|uniref:reverse transcriptase domain-containing protein n=1 Tax=Prevotella sp. CAG:255 TaxID=1262923 RepID=UPI002583B22B
RSVVTNADVHKGQNYILNIDLKDFFPSIEQPRIWKRLQLKPFSFTVPVANVLAGLCSMKEMRTMDDGSKKVFYILPQGAPTSPIITNMICDTLDRRLAGLAKRFGLHYTRYADDITFSSMHNVYQKNGEFRKELLRIIQGQGFTINEKKTRLQKVGGRQEVTGIIVSNKLNVTHDYVRNIRNILYIWDRYGYGVAYAKFFPKYKEDKGHVKKGEPDLVNVIDGKLMYMKMVKGDEDSTYRRLYDKFKTLVDDMRDPVKTTVHSITYVETTPLIEFEKKNNTKIVISMFAPGEHSEKTIDYKPVKVHRYAYFLLDGEKVFASVSKDIKPDMEKRKEHLSISICRDKQDKPFWLVHLSGKTVMSSLVPVDVDELNKELDALLKL